MAMVKLTVYVSRAGLAMQHGHCRVKYVCCARDGSVAGGLGLLLGVLLVADRASTQRC
jgi:hypothetical protein